MQLFALIDWTKIHNVRVVGDYTALNESLSIETHDNSSRKIRDHHAKTASDTDIYTLVMLIRSRLVFLSFPDLEVEIDARRAIAACVDV